jgi:hypothetical protein
MNGHQTYLAGSIAYPRRACLNTVIIRLSRQKACFTPYNPRPFFA